MLHSNGPDRELVIIPLVGGRTVSLRRPNGRDLHEWSRFKPETRSATVTAMLKSLVVEGDATPDDEPTLAHALSELDPLVALTVSCACPVCGSANDVRVDLEEIVLARLRRRQRMLLDDVHTLASRYGWTEAEVLAVPSHRRAQYVAMIKDER